MWVDRLSFISACALSFGSLVFYFVSAFWYRQSEPSADKGHVDFNLGLPKTRDPERLFAITLVAAGTSLSTVFVFFLTATPLYGWWLLICPFMFGLGNYLLYRVYVRARGHGYFSESTTQFGISGLVPYLGYRLTGSNKIGWLILTISLLNLLAVLVLELVIGVEVIGFLVRHTFGLSLSGIGEFAIFSASMLLLFGYVFIGGFRASVASDIWQMAAMRWAILLAFLSLLVWLAFRSEKPLQLSAVAAHPPSSLLGYFILNVVIANLCCPLSQEASWQRFRAFGSQKNFDARRATYFAVLQSIFLWSGLIVISFMLVIAVRKANRPELGTISGVLNAFRTLNDWWFPLLVFPLMTVAALSAMYSTADTCIAALLYLIEYSRIAVSGTRVQPLKKLGTTYYYSMFFILLFSMGVYLFVRVAFSPTVFQLVFSVFSNLVVIAPTVIMTSIYPPATDVNNRTRRRFVAASIAIGFTTYWTSSILAMCGGQPYLWLSQLSILLGLSASIIPLAIFWLIGDSGTQNERGRRWRSSKAGH
jgi:hypothetical protein